DEKFQKTPHLHALLVTGEVSVSKLARVASIATPENEEFLSTQVQVLSKSAVETLVRDEKFNREESVPGHGPQPENLSFSPEVQSRLIELQQKGININDLLLEFLQKRDLEIAQQKEQLGEVAPETTSRYIPAKTRRILTKEHGKCCSVPGCTRPAQAIHHTQRFALTNRHDPRYVAPLCKEHHAIAHSIDLKVCAERRL
ncbi:HNH endonuclease, partial [Candidatus Peregrinibacteria bacterium]|nr:HNH endonuclease [Candidatus Peregrinibacteria bacterium]